MSNIYEEESPKQLAERYPSSTIEQLYRGYQIQSEQEPVHRSSQMSLTEFKEWWFGLPRVGRAALALEYLRSAGVIGKPGLSSGEQPAHAKAQYVKEEPQTAPQEIGPVRRLLGLVLGIVQRRS